MRWITTWDFPSARQSNLTARLLLRILASVAEFEREMIRERVCAGVKNAKRVVFDRSNAREMHGAGLSVREIATHRALAGSGSNGAFQNPIPGPAL